MTVIDSIGLKRKIDKICEDIANDATELIDDIVVSYHNHYEEPRFSIFTKYDNSIIEVENKIIPVIFNVDKYIDQDDTEKIMAYIENELQIRDI